ncbi:H+/Cl-antiporter ClcA [Gulbenkiania indica]|uniref:H+/Cl-antiporter ClcA n=2 Tax=Gulbenkiania TaxID=397456 RepID=A0A0K6GSA2_9NEIS|nr:chloride channel protein [Gulbenkiania indica]TCW32305.1 H+/Cl- antiporter ClcA [Gulbenkiania mobilis]CUA81575.1 H+/Cl-antiporter ClcA [Gulbenkiania indica]
MPTGRSKTRRRLRRQFRYLYWSLTVWRRWGPVWASAVLIGLVACLFAGGSRLSHELFFEIYDHSRYWPLLITPFGLGLSVWLMHRYFPGAAGGGIPQAIVTLEPAGSVLRDRFLSLRAALGKMLLTLLGISSGATFGYEGPIVQVGAALKYSLSRRTYRNEGQARSLILAGGAAGVAAAFNTPLAGIVFAIEEMGRTFDQRASRTILFSVILAGLTAIAVMGNDTYFGRASAAELELGASWIAVPLCAVLGGVLGGLTATVMLRLSERLPGPLHACRLRFPVLFAAACGLVIALIGIASGGTTFGTGYFRASDILAGHPEGLENYGLLKLVTMLLSFISGAPGGSFAPSLAVGAGLGLNMAELLPFLPATPVILLGMVAFFAGMTRAPLTGFVIVMEMTDSSTMIIPLMATALIAANLSRFLTRRPLYEGQARLILHPAAAKPTAAPGAN